jgi:NAD(P)-dependent dehydrogenase (short-subunit alcohol dehydrogenase family)
MELKNKVAVVTGSTHGIGRAMAARFAEMGAHAIVTGRNRENGEAVTKEIRAMGGLADYIRTDLSSEEQVKALMHETISRFGGIDILVNNAAATDSIVHTARDKRCTDLATEDFDYIMKVGIYAPFWTCKYALPSMVKRGGGSVINVTSTAGWNAVPDLTAYACSKGGIQTFTKVIAIDYGKEGVRCNCIVVGYVRDAGIGSEIFDDPKTGPMFRGVSMINKVGKPRNIADLAAFLASDRAEFITGILIPCDGGLSSKLATPHGVTGGFDALEQGEQFNRD